MRYRVEAYGSPLEQNNVPDYIHAQIMGDQNNFLDLCTSIDKQVFPSVARIREKFMDTPFFVEEIPSVEHIVRSLAEAGRVDIKDSTLAVMAVSSGEGGILLGHILLRLL
jgi:hypothetical protein